MDNKLNNTKNKLIDTTLLGIIIVLIPTLFASVLRYFETGWQWIYLFHTIVSIVIICLYFIRHKINAIIKTHIIALSLLVISFIGTIKYGISGPYFFCVLAVIITSLILGKRIGMRYLILSISGTFISIIIYRFSYFHTQIDFNIYNNNGTTLLALFISIIFVLIVSVYILRTFYDFFVNNINELHERTNTLELAQNKMKISEENYRILVENTAFPVIVSTIEGTLLFVNQRTEQFYGKTLSEMLKVNANDFWVDKEQRKMFINEIVLQRNVNNMEVLLISRDNVVKTVLLSANSIEYEGQMAIITVYNDITAHKSSERLLLEKDHRIRASFDLSFIFIGLLTIEGELIEVNKMALEFAGLRLEDVIGKLFWETPWWNHSIEEQQKLKESILKASKGEIVAYEAINKGIDGLIHYIDFTLRPILNEIGQVIYLIPEGHDITNIKRANEEIKQRELFLNSLINTIPDLIWLKDNDGFYLKCNKRFEELFGKKEIDILGKTDYDFFDKELADTFRKNDSLALKAAKPTINEELVTFVDGHAEYLETLKTPIVNENNIILGVLGIGRDITERKRAEKINAENQLKLKTIIESTKDFIWSVDAETFSILTFNTALKDYFKNNHNVTIQVGSCLDDLLPKNLQIIWNDFYNKALEMGPFDQIYNFDGRGVILHLSFYPLLLDSKIIGISIFGKDITEIKNSELALKRSEERLQKLLHSVTDYMYSVIVENGKIIEMIHSEGCFSITGYSTEEFKNNSQLWLNIIPNSDNDSIEKYNTFLIHSKDTLPFEHRIIHKNGTIRWVRNTPVLRFNKDKMIIGYDGLISDITEAKLSESKVLQSVIKTEEKERLHFSQELHDGIGPLLSAIKMYVQWFGTAEAAENKNEILKDIENLIEESSATIREISFKLSPHILQNYGLEEALKAFVNKIQNSSKIDIALNCQKNCRFEENAETIIYRVICECINNTIKHANATKITIDLYSIDSLFYIDYSDNGSGFDVESIYGKHKGIGLTNMQSRINSINGMIDIKSSSNGTTIKFQFDTQYL
jgi:PAS domain S-box-containing protein